MTMPDALARCLVLTTVATVRQLLRRGDARLKPHGVTVQQFALLAAIRFHPGEPASSLAQKVALDRTSLIRSLDLLEAKGLIARAQAGGNARICHLTEAGDRLLGRLLEDWTGAQAERMAGLAPGEDETYLRVARHLVRD